MIEIHHKFCADGKIIITVTDGDKVLDSISFDDNKSALGAKVLLSEVLFKLGYPSKFIWHEEAAK